MCDERLDLNVSEMDHNFVGMEYLLDMKTLSGADPQCFVGDPRVANLFSGGSRIFPKGFENSQIGIILQFLCRKLHENE